MQFDSHKKPTYIFKYPFRFVKPYKHVYETYAKQRWLGNNILSTLTKEFLAYSEEYFREAIIAGKVKINGSAVSLDYVIKNSDLLQHETIREEPPVLDLPIEIVHEDENFLVVNKPPSLIIHTGGGYHYNTLMAILYYEKDYKNLYILHRLDRLTSGVVILAKQKEKTTKFHEESMEEIMKKCYFARVGGNFGFEEKVVSVKMVCLSHKEGVWSVYNEEKMEELGKKEQPKDSQTRFIKVWYDPVSDSSLLECYPITGRTHQIRVHLQYLGHSILNDVVYGGRFVGNCIIDKIDEIKHKVEIESDIVDKVEKRIKHDKEDSNGNNEKKEHKEEDDEEYEDPEWYEKWDFKNKPMEIFLHSYKYRFEESEYVSRKPYWTEINTVKSCKKEETLEELEMKEKNTVIADVGEKDNRAEFKTESKRVSTYEKAFLKKAFEAKKQQPKTEEVAEEGQVQNSIPQIN